MQDIKSLCGDRGGGAVGGGGEELSLCALSSHLLPLFICCAAAERLDVWRGGERGVDCMFSSPVQPLCLQAAWVKRRRGREARQTEESAGDVKPDLLPYLLPPSLHPSSTSTTATSPESLRDSRSNLILGLRDWKHTPRKRGREGGRRNVRKGGVREKRERDRNSAEEREIPELCFQDWKTLPREKTEEGEPREEWSEGMKRRKEEKRGCKKRRAAGRKSRLCETCSFPHSFSNKSAARETCSIRGNAENSFRF